MEVFLLPVSDGLVLLLVSYRHYKFFVIYRDVKKVIVSDPLNLECQVRTSFTIPDERKINLSLFIPDVNDCATFDNFSFTFLNEKAVNKIEVTDVKESSEVGRETAPEEVPGNQDISPRPSSAAAEMAPSSPCQGQDNMHV